MDATVEQRPQGRHDLTVRRIRPAHEQVAHQLRELMMSGEMAPGDRLPADELLSADFGVSRDTLREAIRLLRSQSLVHTKRGRSGGTFVSEADPEAVRRYLETNMGLMSGSGSYASTDLSGLREALEVSAARFAACRRTELQVSTMRTTIARGREQSGRGDRFERNRLFHAQILEAADNRLLSVLTIPIHAVIAARFLEEESHPFPTRVDHEHSEIVDCIERGDADRAGNCMASHLTTVADIYGKSI